MHDYRLPFKTKVVNWGSPPLTISYIYDKKYEVETSTVETDKLHETREDVSRDFDTLSNIASHTQPSLVPPSAEQSPTLSMPPLITATAKVHSADENQVGANNGGGIYRWPEFDFGPE